MPKQRMRYLPLTLSITVIAVICLVLLSFTTSIQKTLIESIKRASSYVDATSEQRKVYIINKTSLDAPLDLNNHLKEQRNELSKLLNEMKQLYGQQSCEMMKLKNLPSSVSANGGWCAEASSPNSTSHITDEPFAMALSRFLATKSVVSFGDGPGTYKKLLDSDGQVKSYEAFDGAPYCETVTGNVVKFLDLTAPQYGLPIFDWAVSIEVAEHIPAKFENVYLGNLVRHAREGIILSWAVPGQGGLAHVNNKALSDVADAMSKRGFNINITAGEPLRSSATYGWLKNNIHVYYRDPQHPINEIDA